MNSINSKFQKNSSTPILKLKRLITIKQMKIDTLQLPNWDKVWLHRNANRIGKRYVSSKVIPQGLPDYGLICQQCGRKWTHCPEFKFCQPSEQVRGRYGFYGPNCVIYLGFIKRIAIFMFAVTVLFMVPVFVLNLLGSVCRNVENACTAQDIFYFWSTYNVLGENPGSLPHHIIWFLLSIVICLFTLYLRRYSLQTFRKINNRNVTDSDFAIILRGLPDNTTQQDIKYLLQRQVLLQYDKSQDKNLKVLQQMRNIRVRNVILIRDFNDMFKMNEKNVQNFKKVEKKKAKLKKERLQRGQIKQIPGQIIYQQQPAFFQQPIPKPQRFANSAIVRFQTSRQRDLILKTIHLFFLNYIIMYFFPFYHPKTQYRIGNTNISMQRAPQPSDIQWQNVSYSQEFRIVRKLLCTLFTTTLLLLSAGITFSVSLWIESILSRTGIQPTLLTIILVVVTLGINILIQVIIGFAIKLVKLDTFTDQMCEQMSVSVVSQTISLGFLSIFGPLVAKIPSFIQLDTSGSSTFPVIMFTTIITQSFVETTIGFIVDYTQIVRKVKQFLVKNQILFYTNTQAFELKGPLIPFAPCYSRNVVIFWFSFLFGVVSPICVLIGALGTLLFYYYQKILFNSIYSIPPYLGSRLNATMIDLMDFCAVLIGVFNLVLYTSAQSLRNFEYDNRIIGIIITNIVIGGVYAIFPWRTVLRKFYNQRECNSIQYFVRDQLDTSYENCYPFYGIESINEDLGLNSSPSKKKFIQEQQKQRVKVDIRRYIDSVYSQENILQANNNCCYNK